MRLKEFLIVAKYRWIEFTMYTICGIEFYRNYSRFYYKKMEQISQIKLLQRSITCPDYKKIKVMRSKVFQRILNDMDKDPWWVKLKRWFVVEYYVIKCLGLIKYFKNRK